MAFNPDEYFNRRVQQEMDADRLRGHSTRFEELQAASREKALLLDKAAERSRARIAEDQSSLVSTLGLNPDGTGGEAVNLGAHLLSGASRVIGAVAAVPSNVLAAVSTINITDEDRAAYARYKNQVATPADLALLSRKQFANSTSDITVGDRLDTEQQQLGVADGIRNLFDINYLKHNGKTNALNDQLGETFQQDWSTVQSGWKDLTGEDKLDGFVNLSKGAGSLLANAIDAGADNPLAVSEYIAENAPQLMMGASNAAKVMLAAFNTSYAFENYTKGIEEYKAANNGEYPPEEVRQKMAGWAASLALAEQVGDVTALKTVFGGAKKAATEAATEVAKKGVRQAVLRTAKAGATGAATEAATEGYQTFAESQTGANGYMKDPVTDKYLRDKDGNLIAKTASAEDIYKGATIGGLTGGGLSAGGRAIGESAQLVADGLDTLKDLKVPEGRVISGQKEVIDQVAETGDAAPLLDKASPMYAPEKAVAALQSWATKVNTPEAWAKVEDVAQSTLEALENERTTSRMLLESASPEGRQILEKDLALAKEVQSKMAETNSPDLQEQTAYVAELEAELAAAAKPDPSDLKLMQKRAAQLDTRIASVTQAFEGIAQRKSLAAESATVPETATLEGTEVETSAAEVAPPATSAPETTLTLSMRAPQQVTPESAEALANDTTNELVPEQRTYLKSFAAARKAEADLERVYEDNKDIFEVNQEVLYGSDKNMGLPQHRRAILAALNSGSPRKLAYARTLFAKFQQTHADKLNRPNPRSKNGEHTVAFTNVIKSEQEAMAALAAEMDALIVARKATPKTAAPAAKTTPATPAPVATAPATPVTPATPVAPPAATAPAVKATPLPTPVPKKDPVKAKVSRAVNEAKDTMLEVLVKIGGLDPVDAEANGVDPVHFDAQEEGLGMVFFEGGSTIEEAAASMTDLGYLLPNENGEADIDAFMEALNTSLTGTPVYTSEGYQAATLAEEQARIEEDKEFDNGLEVMREKTTEDSPYQSRNFPADFFKQIGGRLTDATLRPLVMVKDFVSKYLTGGLDLGPFIDGVKLTTKQETALVTFMRAAKAWQKDIQANLPVRVAEDKRLYDLMQYFLQDTESGAVDIEENLKTAIAYGAYSAMLDLASKPLLSTQETMNKQLGRPKTAMMSRASIAELETAGEYLQLLRNSIGQRIVDALGLKASKGAPKDVDAKLVEVLGAHGLKLLEEIKLSDGKVGLIQRKAVNGVRMAQMRMENLTESEIAKLQALEADIAGKNKGEHVMHYFFSIARNEDGTLHPDVAALVEKNRGTQGILDKLFKVTGVKTAPLLEPSSKVQKKASGTDMGVPGKLREILLENQKHPRTLRTDLWGFLKHLEETNTAVFEQMLGIESIDERTTHVRDIKAIQAKNDGLRQEWEMLNGFVEETLLNSPDGFNTKFFLEFDVWKQHRVGIATSTVNPQTSKIVRFLIGSPDWEQTIESNNDEHMASFWLRVAEGFGVKTEQVTNEKAIKEIKAKFIQGKEENAPVPPYAAAVEALIKAIALKSESDELSPDEQNAIADAIGDKRIHALDALTAVAYQQLAERRASGSKDTSYSFTTRMIGEVDGVANGTMLNHILYGAAGNSSLLNMFLEMGGIYTLVEAKARFTNYNLYKAASTDHLDIYQKLARTVFKTVRDSIHPEDGHRLNRVNSVWALTGEIFSEKEDAATSAGRNLMKEGVNPLAFGSALDRVKANMAQAAVDGVYKQFSKLAKQVPEATNAEVQALVAHINTLINRRDIALPVGKDLDWYMKYELTEQQEAAIRKSFAEVVGDIAGEVLAEQFSHFIDRRTKMTETTNLAANLYNAMYTGVRKAFVQELIDTGVLPVSAKGNPLRDLTFAEEAEFMSRVAAAMPQLNTYFSKLDPAGSQTGLRPVKTQRKQSLEIQYSSDVRFGRPVKKTGTKYMSIHGMKKVWAEPGVAMVSAMTHAHDSVVSHLTQLKMDVLNIHDAVATGVLSLKAAAKLMNQNTWEVMLATSPLEESFLALERMVVAMAEMAKNGTLTQDAINNISAMLAADKNLKGYKAKDAIKLMLLNAKSEAAKADKIKLEAMTTWAVVDQYAYEGGQYDVTPEDRAAAQTLLTKVTEDLSPATTEALEVLSQALTGPKKATPQKPVKVSTAPELEGATTPEASVPSVDSSDSNPDADANGESSLDEDLTVLKNGLDRKSFIQMANLFARGIKDTKLSEEARAMLREWAVLLEQGKLLWAGVETRLNALGVELATELAGILETTDGVEMFGAQGAPAIPAHPDLVALFEGNEKPSLKRVLNTLMRIYRAQPAHRLTQFNMEQLVQLSKVLPDSLEIQLITADTDPATLRSVPVAESHGWFSANSDGQSIYVLGPDLVASNLNPDMLLHELVHGALAQLIADELAKKAANPAYTSDALALVEELDRLRLKAVEFAQGNQKLTDTYAAALADVQEFVAWGLAHQGFQREVLTKISMTPQTSKNRLVTGMSDFIKWVTQLLFKGSDKSRQKIAVSGMTLMISNTSGLFAAVAEEVNTRQTQVMQSMATPSSSATVQAYSTQDVLSALLAQNPPQNPGFAAHLESVLSDMVTRLHGPFGSLKAALSQGVTGAPIDRWIKALDSGQAPFASLVRKAPFAVSDAELFMIEQVEVTVRAALEGDTENQGSFAASELRRLFVEMRNNLIKGQDLTKEQHDFLFRIEGNGQTTSDYLSRFAAMVLAHEEVRNLAVVATNRSQSLSLQASKMGIGEQVQRWFLKVLQFFSSQFAGTRMNSPGNIRMKALVQRLVDIEAQRKHLLKAPLQDFLEGPAKVAEKAMEQGRKAVTAIVDSNWVQNKAFLPIRVAGKAASIIVNDRLQSSAQGLLLIRDKALASKHGLAASLATELVGHKEKLLAILRHSKVLENLRKDVITGYAKAALEAFADGKTMSKNQKHALTQVFLRSGAHVLLSRYSVIDITNMVGDPVALDNAITQLEAEAMRIGGSNYGHYFRQQALFSGYAQVTGRVVTPNFMMNAHNIAAMFGTLQHEDDTGSLRAQAEPVIAALIALNAIKYAPPVQKDMALAIARKELQRNGENGIEFLLRTQAQLEHESRQTSFKGKDALMVHGFVPDINNPYTETKIGLRSEKANLELQGWTYVYDITPSPGESVAAPEAMYVMRGAGLQPWMSGFIEIHSQAAKGTLLIEQGKVTKNPKITASQAMSAMASGRVRQVQSLFTDLGKIDPTAISQEYSAPLLNANGATVNYRHLMHETTKDTLLGRDSGFDQVLGVLAGSVFDKEALPKHNDLAISALHELYEEEYKYNPDGFIRVGPRSPDMEMRERWRLLSPEAQATALRLFGKDGMWVPKNAVDLALGFRKKSLGDIFAGDPDARKWYEQAITVPVEWMLATYARQRLLMNEQEVAQYIKRARVLVTKGDRMWQEIAREIKDIVVVKTGLTLLGNMTSNWLQLWAEGLSWKEIFQYSQIALRGALEYRQDSQKLMRLESQMSSGYLGTDAAEVQSEINRLRDKIQRNPVHADIEAGLMPSIVEDVQEDIDPYSYKSILTEWVQGNLAKLGKKGSPIRETARWAYMTKDTWMYQGLSRMTQLSDFTARHALKQHLMHRKTNPLSKDAAVEKASSAFINYDVALHPILQGLDDRGLLLFTKYIVRIQPVLLRLFREKPLRMIMMMVANGWIDTGPIITDSALVSRLGNPLEAGAFGIFDALNETATVAGAIALID